MKSNLHKSMAWCSKFVSTSISWLPSLAAQSLKICNVACLSRPICKWAADKWPVYQVASRALCRFLPLATLLVNDKRHDRARIRFSARNSCVAAARAWVGPRDPVHGPCDQKKNRNWTSVTGLKVACSSIWFFFSPSPFPPHGKMLPFPAAWSRSTAGTEAFFFFHSSPESDDI